MDDVATERGERRVGTSMYEVRVAGRCGDWILAAFDGFAVTTEPVETVLHGPVEDQAALHGLLNRVQSLGLELLEVRRLPPSD